VVRTGGGRAPQVRSRATGSEFDVRPRQRGSTRAQSEASSGSAGSAIEQRGQETSGSAADVAGVSCQRRPRAAGTGHRTRAPSDGGRLAEARPNGITGAGPSVPIPTDAAGAFGGPRVPEGERRTVNARPDPSTGDAPSPSFDRVKRRVTRSSTAVPIGIWSPGRPRRSPGGANCDSRIDDDDHRRDLLGHPSNEGARDERPRLPDGGGVHDHLPSFRGGGRGGCQPDCSGHWNCVTSWTG